MKQFSLNFNKIRPKFILVKNFNNQQYKKTFNDVSYLKLHKLIQGRESGTIHNYILPHLELTKRFAVACEPRLLALNATSS